MGKLDRALAHFLVQKAFLSVPTGFAKVRFLDCQLGERIWRNRRPLELDEPLLGGDFGGQIHGALGDGLLETGPEVRVLVKSVQGVFIGQFLEVA